MDTVWRICGCSALYFLSHLNLVCSEFCADYGHSCAAPYRCCGEACCIPTDLEDHYRHHLRWSVWNMWYFWFVVLFVLMSCFGACSYYRRHQLLLARHQAIMNGGGTPSRGLTDWRITPSFPVSLFSGYSSRAQAQRPESAQQAEPYVPRQVFPSPPAYSDVVTHPEEYPQRKDPELPPYPGLGHQELISQGLPPYSATVVQLPPYSTPSDRLDNQTTTDSHHSNQATSATVSSSSGVTQYNCSTQTVSGIGTQTN